MSDEDWEFTIPVTCTTDEAIQAFLRAELDAHGVNPGDIVHVHLVPPAPEAKGILKWWLRLMKLETQIEKIWYETRVTRERIIRCETENLKLEKEQTRQKEQMDFLYKFLGDCNLRWQPQPVTLPSNDITWSSGSYEERTDALKKAVLKRSILRFPGPGDE